MMNLAAGMRALALTAALALSACASDGGSRNEAYKQIKHKQDTVVAHFQIDGTPSTGKVANGFYRKLLGTTEAGTWVVQDFYSRNDQKQSAPLLMNNESALKRFDNAHTDGEVTLYYANGAKMEQSVYEAGKLVGNHTSYYPDGTVFQVNQFENGQLNGRSQFYHPDGKLAANLEYLNGALVNVEGWTPDGASVGSANLSALVKQLQDYDAANMKEFYRLAK